MVTRGLVAKAREPGNKRITVLTLTPNGQSVYDRALTLGCAYNAAFAACLSDTEAGVLDDLLGRLEARAVMMNAGERDADPVDAD